MAKPYQKLKQVKNGKPQVKTNKRLGVIMKMMLPMELNMANYTIGMR